MSAASLLDALAAAGRALDQGDAVAASQALDRAHQARAALEAAGLPLASGELARARALYADCQASFARCREGLTLALERSGRSQRAFEAYRR